jgi:hypothetical protein
MKTCDFLGCDTVYSGNGCKHSEGVYIQYIPLKHGNYQTAQFHILCAQH